MKYWQKAIYGLVYGNINGIKYEFGFHPELDNETDDDSEMAILALKHVIKHNRINPLELENDYRKWAKEDGNGIGIHTANVLLYDEQNKDSEGNGAMMRFIPFALYLYEDVRMPLEDIYKEIEREARITHDNDNVVEANIGIFSQLINDLFTDSKEKTLEYKRFIQTMEEKDYSNNLDTAWIYPTWYWIQICSGNIEKDQELATKNIIDADTVFAVKYAILYCLDKKRFPKNYNTIYNGKLKDFITSSDITVKQKQAFLEITGKQFDDDYLSGRFISKFPYNNKEWNYSPYITSFEYSSRKKNLHIEMVNRMTNDRLYDINEDGYDTKM